FLLGVTLPVATTLLARSPFSTLARFEGSIFVPPLLATMTPTEISRTITATTLPQIISLRRFFLPLVPLPFTTPPRCTAKWRLGAIAPSLLCTPADCLSFLNSPENKRNASTFTLLVKCHYAPYSL